MKLLISLTILILLQTESLLLLAQNINSDSAANQVPLKMIAQEFSSTLQGVLLSELKKGGPESAVSVCSDTAQKLTAEIGRKYNVNIRRVSMKYRNPENAPRSESEKEFLAKMEASESLPDIRDQEQKKNTESGKEGEQFFSAPIKIGAPCLQCHGTIEQIKPETLKKINNIYPADKARGYKPGDFRGALIIERK